MEERDDCRREKSPYGPQGRPVRGETDTPQAMAGRCSAADLIRHRIATHHQEVMGLEALLPIAVAAQGTLAESALFDLLAGISPRR